MSDSSHKKPSKTNGGAKRTQTEHDAYLHFLDELESDPDSISGAGRCQNERRMIAERLVDSSMDCSDPMLAMAYALRAVRLNPAALDARVLLAIAAEGPRDEFIEELQAIVAAGEADLGEKFFRENHGDFWGLIETRPYMRARCRLAEELYDAGRIGEAICHYEEMLQLNPNDNQGLRYTLLGHYLETDDLAGAGRLLKEYEDEGSAMFGWARVLERYLSSDLPGAVNALQHARKENFHVEEFLTGQRKLPKDRPDFYSIGDLSEALVCMDEIGPAWIRHREAVQWLKNAHGSGHLFAKEPHRK